MAYVDLFLRPATNGAPATWMPLTDAARPFLAKDALRAHEWRDDAWSYSLFRGRGGIFIRCAQHPSSGPRTPGRTGPERHGRAGAAW